MRFVIDLSQHSVESLVKGIENAVGLLRTEAWYEQEWVIALLSALTGVVSSFVIQWIASLRNNWKRKKRLSKDLLMEVHANISKSKKTKLATEDVLKKFQVLVSSGSFTSHPNLINTRTETFKVIFESCHNSLHLLPTVLQSKVYLFYQIHVRNIEVCMHHVQDRFEKFYHDSPLVSSNDVIQILENLIQNINQLIAVGEGIEAELLLLSGEHRKLVEGWEEEHYRANRKVDKYLRSLKPRESFAVSEVVSLLGVQPVHVHTRALRSRRLKSNDIGGYTKKEVFWKLRGSYRKVSSWFKARKKKNSEIS